MNSENNCWLPSAKGLEDWLNLTETRGIDDLIGQSLLAPLVEFLNRPSKHFRGQLVRVGFDLINSQNNLSQYVSEAMQVLEAIHAASLVVDDIQDNSEWRRGKPTLHRTYGIPVALNSANWLYFWPFETIEKWNLPPQVKLDLNRACYRALIRAHSGQALDVGTPVSDLPQERVKSVCLASLELKTGALTALALELGAILAGADLKALSVLTRVGTDFGVALQMFDDLGNIKEKSVADPKRFEDLKGLRPSWVWASAADHLTPNEYLEFKRVVSTLPAEDELNRYFRTAPWVRLAHEKAKEFLNSSLKQLNAPSWNEKAVRQLIDLSETLKRAYE
ncbi:MAG: polyprenyl synthetase family protein [Pseudomonadota bacterium]